MDADAIVRFIWNDEASRPSREAFAKMYDYMQANPDPLPDGVVRKRPAQETFAGQQPTEDERPADPDCVKCAGKGWLWGRELDDADPPTMEDTMTKYSCDSTGCRDARLTANR